MESSEEHLKNISSLENMIIPELSIEYLLLLSINKKEVV
jgi:hypothetical protein